MRGSVRPSIRPSVRPSVRNALYHRGVSEHLMSCIWPCYGFISLTNTYASFVHYIDKQKCESGSCARYLKGVYCATQTRFIWVTKGVTNTKPGYVSHKYMWCESQICEVSHKHVWCESQRWVMWVTKAGCVSHKGRLCESQSSFCESQKYLKWATKAGHASHRHVWCESLTCVMWVTKAGHVRILWWSRILAWLGQVHSKASCCQVCPTWNKNGSIAKSKTSEGKLQLALLGDQWSLMI